MSWLYATGLVSEAFIFCIFLLCAKKVKEFRLNKYMISYLGTTASTASLFNTSLIIYTALRILFIFSLFSFFSLWSQTGLLILLFATFLLILIASFIPSNKNRKIHTVSGFLVGMLSIVFVFIVGMKLWSYSTKLAQVNILLSIVMLLGSVAILYWKKHNSYFELFFFTMIVVWDVVMTGAMFGLIK